MFVKCKCLIVQNLSKMLMFSLYTQKHVKWDVSTMDSVKY